jgi:hypothetical protein
VTEFLFDWSPELSPGDMSEWRSLIVGNEMLGLVTVRNDFSSHLRHSSQQLQRDIDRYVDLFSGLSLSDSPSFPSPSPTNSPSSPSTLPPSRVPRPFSQFLYSDLNSPKALADIFEALIGAVFIDSGGRIEECRKLVSSLLIEPLIIPLLVDEGDGEDGSILPDESGERIKSWSRKIQRHPVSVIHEIVSIFTCREFVTAFNEERDDDNDDDDNGDSPPSRHCYSRMRCRMSCHGHLVAEGRGENKKRARLAAALSISSEQLVEDLKRHCTCRDW